MLREADEICSFSTAEMEYEEVLLKRPKNSLRLGLTLAYDGDNSETDIFVSQIEPNSVAEESGRIRVGDQILRINGKSMRTRKDVLTEFGKNPMEFLLLISRIKNQNDIHDEEGETSSESSEDEEVLINITETGNQMEYTSKDKDQNGKHLILANNFAMNSSVQENQATSSRENNSGGADPGPSVSTSDPDPDSLIMAAELLNKAEQIIRRNNLEGSYEGEFIRLQKEMANIQLGCSRLMEKQRASQKLSQERGSESSGSKCLNSPSIRPPSNEAPGAIAKKEFMFNGPEKSGLRYSSCTIQSFNNKKSSEKPTDRNFVSEQLTSKCQNEQKMVVGTTGLLPPSPLITKEETTSSGVESCRSTPKENAKSLISKPILKKIPEIAFPARIDSIDSALVSPDSSEHFYHSIETPPTLSSTSTTMHSKVEMFRLPNCPANKFSTRASSAAPQPRVSFAVRPESSMSGRSREYQPGDIFFTSPERLNETIALQQRLLLQMLEEEDCGDNFNATKTSYRNSVSPKAQMQQAPKLLKSKPTPSLWKTNSLQRPPVLHLTPFVSQQQRQKQMTPQPRQQQQHQNANNVGSFRTPSLLLQPITPPQQNHQHQQQSSLANYSIGKKDPPYDNVPDSRMSSVNRTFGNKVTEEERRSESPHYEWRVKRRSDGTVRFTRRLIKIGEVKARREEQLNRERHGFSTDDDAASAVGKFWPKYERKRHLEIAKQRKEEQRKQRAGDKVGLTPPKTSANVDKELLKLCQERQQRNTDKQLLDKFHTIQEFLAHGARDSTKVGGILSVTTV